MEALEKRLGKATGGKHQHKSYRENLSTDKNPSKKTAPPTQKELGLDKDRIQRNRKLESLGDTKRREIIDDLKKRGKGVSPNAIAAVERKQKKELLFSLKNSHRGNSRPGATSSEKTAAPTGIARRAPAETKINCFPAMPEASASPP